MKFRRIDPATMRAWLPWFFLCCGLLLEGAKDAGDFVVWASIFFLAAPLWLKGRAKMPLIRPHASVAILLLAAITSFLFSFDRGSSLFALTQLVVYTSLWVWLRNSETLQYRQSYEGWILAALAVVTIVRLAIECSTHMRQPSAWLPINPNFNAAWMASLALMLTGAAFATGVRDRLSRWVFLGIAGALAGFVCVGPLGSASRSALVGLAAGAVFLARPYVTWRRMALVAGVLAVALLALPRSVLLKRLSVAPAVERSNIKLLSYQGGSDYRRNIWGISLKAMRDRPTTGYGPGTFELAYLRHAFPVDDPVRYATTTEFAHNEILQVGADLGIPAMLAALWGLGAYFWRIRRIREPRAAGAAAGVISLTLMAMLNPIWHNPFLVYWTLFLAAWSLSSLLTDQPRLNQSSRFGRPGIAALLGVFFAGVVLTTAVGLRNVWQRTGRADLRIGWLPFDAEGWVAAAATQQSRTESLALLREAVRRSPAQPYYWEALGGILQQAPDAAACTEALQAYETARRLAPGRATNPLAIGKLWIRLGKPENALAAFQQATYWEPHYWEAHLWTSRALAALGHRDEALRILREIPEARRELIGSYRATRPLSGYERQILGYDADVIANEVQSLRARPIHGRALAQPHPAM
jgi:O-antigen ligase